MPQETPVDEIVVVGQRRRPGGTFPSRSGSGSGEPGGDHQIEVTDDPGQPTPPPDPCADPETRKEWNADAAAAEALRLMIAKANLMDGFLGRREFGAILYRRPDGSIGIGNITWGPPFDQPDPETGRTYVELDYSGIPPASIIGSIHSHNAGSFRPSGDATGQNGDWGHYFGLRNLVLNSGGNPDTVRIYIAAQELVTGPTVSHGLKVYDSRNKDAALAGQDGPEVNPEAQPCPGS